MGGRHLLPLWDLGAGWTQAAARLADVEKAGQAGLGQREEPCGQPALLSCGLHEFP